MKPLIALVLLTACGTLLPGEKAGGLFEVYRDTSVPIASKAVFEPARYLGTWYEVARFPVPFEVGCAKVTATYGQQDDGDISVLNVCRNLDGSVKSTISGSAEIVGPGRLAVRFPSVPFGASDYWVLWVDEGYRTAVVGAPNGRSGWILNRDPQIPQDRLNAAREVLDFNGYDLARLMAVPQ
uniref:lipocalin family protein n=1 Tax=Yoonia sp. TaxID=2212373 RepID=UPI004048687A|tara:strand:- start:179014 stop:179559 length:546 start_codon:yes stop_codon:yes gene_type:complete